MSEVTTMSIAIEKTRLETEYKYRSACREAFRLLTLIKAGQREPGRVVTFQRHFAIASDLDDTLGILGYTPKRRLAIVKKEQLNGQLLAAHELAALVVAGVA